MKNNFSQKAKKITESGNKIILDIGCGKVLRGNIGLDFFDGPNVDVVSDLNSTLPIADASCDEVKMFHILEHVKEPLFLLEEVKRILKSGGLVEIRVPHFTNVTAYQIHHRSYWNSFSLDPILLEGSKSNESSKLFSLVSKEINLLYFKKFQKYITKNKYLYELFLCKIFPAYEVVFILKK